MADKKFFTSVNNTDIIQQSEDGGGIKLTTDGKFIFGAKHQNVIDQLADENYNGTVDLNANNQSFIAVMNENSHAIEVEVPINHFSSLETPTDNVVTTNQTQPNGQNNSTGCDFLNYPPKDYIKPSGEIKKGYLRSSLLSAYTSFLNHENDYKKLGWGNYGVSTSKQFWDAIYPNSTAQDGDKYPNVPNLKAKINDASNLTFDEALYNMYTVIGFFNIDDDKKLQDVANNISPSKENRYVKYYNHEILQYKDPAQVNILTNLIINHLPSPLRIMMARVIYNSGFIPAVSRLLVTTRKVALKKDPQTTLGISEEESTSGGKDPISGAKLNSLSDVQKLEKYSDQIDNILDLYNNDKTNFLNALKDEFDRFYNKLVDQRKDPNSSTYQKRFKDNEAEFRKFYNEYNQIALDEALKDTDCPNEPILMPRDYAPIQVQQQTPAPSPSVFPTTSPPPAPTTVEEANEDIYEANFLPMNETDYIQLDKSDCKESTDLIVDEILTGKVKTYNISPSDIQANDLDLNEALKWVKLGGKGIVGSSDAKTDYDAGRLNYNVVKDIGSAAKACGFTVVITTAKTGHKPGSFHEVGWGCDVAIVNGRGYGGGDSKFKADGDKLKDALISLGYKWLTNIKGVPNTTASETGSPTHKCVIWQYKGHYNHLHISSTIEYPGWTNPNPIPSKWQKLQIDGATGESKN